MSWMLSSHVPLATLSCFRQNSCSAASSEFLRQVKKQCEETMRKNYVKKQCETRQETCGTPLLWNIVNVSVQMRDQKWHICTAGQCASVSRGQRIFLLHVIISGKQLIQVRNTPVANMHKKRYQQNIWEWTSYTGYGFDEVTWSMFMFLPVQKEMCLYTHARTQYVYMYIHIGMYTWVLATTISFA